MRAALIVLALGLAAASAWAQQEPSPESGTALEVPLPSQELEDEDAPTGVESIAVTGERLDAADVQDEAQAISAFTMDQLDRANISNVEGLAFNVPSLHIGNQGNQAIITLRGIGTENASITGEPGVQFHVDGMNYARPSAARVAFFDLEAVKVHRGPHGTAGGKNSTGGAIHVVTRKPSNEFEGEFDFEWGAYDQRRYRGALNIPLLDEVLAARFAFISEDHYGYQKNLRSPSKSDRADDADNIGLRGHLLFTPTDSLEMLFSYNYYRAKGVGPGAKLVGEPELRRCKGNVPRDLISSNAARGIFFRGIDDNPDGTFWLRFSDPSADFFVGFAREALSRIPAQTFCADLQQEQFAGQPVSEDPSDPRLIYLDQIQSQSNQIWGWANTITWQLPDMPVLGASQLIVLTGFESTSLSDPRDFDNTDLPFFSLDPVDNDSYQYENQVRLEGTTGELLDWSVGTFFQRERSELLAEGAIFQELGLRIDQTNKVKSYGVHAETAWHIGDAFTLTMGARFNRDFKETSLWRDNGQKFLFSGSVTPVGLCIVARDVPAYAESLPDRRVDDQAEDGLWCEDDWRRWTGGIALEWRPSDDHLLYAQYDTGYKAGGFIVAGAGDFEPETVQAWTLGSKSLLLGGLLTLNLEAFFYEYENYQVVEIDGLTLRTENAPKARVWGAEVEFDAEPLPGLRLNGQAGYLNTEFTDYCSVDPTFAGLAFDVRNDLLECDDLAGGAVKALDDDGNRLAASTFDLDGNDLARSPKFSYTLGAEYRFSLGDWGSLTPRIQYYWQDETYYRAYNTARDFQEKYHKTDLKLLWRSPEESWTLEAFVENLEDEDVFQNLVIGGAPVGSPAVGYYSSPRLYGFRVGYRF